MMLAGLDAGPSRFSAAGLGSGLAFEGLCVSVNNAGILYSANKTP